MLKFMFEIFNEISSPIDGTTENACKFQPPDSYNLVRQAPITSHFLTITNCISIG